MSVAIILPARLASTRLPNKLLLDRSGKTVLEHTIDRAFEAISQGLVARIIVATDNRLIAEAANRANVEAVMTSPDHTSGTDRIAEVAANLKEEIIVNLQADEPEIDPKNIRAVAQLLSAPEKAPMATLAVPIFDESLWQKSSVVKVVVSGNGHAMYFSRATIPFVRDDSPPAAPLWQENGRRVFGLHHVGIYAYRRDFLLGYKSLPASKLEQLEKLEQLRALEAGHSIKVAVVEHNPPGIDTPEDYEAFLQRLKAKNQKPETRNQEL